MHLNPESIKQDIEARKSLQKFDEMQQRFSMSHEELEKMEAEEINIIDGIVFSGQICIIVARPSGGKTLIAQHWAGEMAATGSKVAYIFEDAGMGIYKRISEQGMKDGYSVLSSMARPGESTDTMLEFLQTMANSGQDLKGVVFFIDTLKKFTDILDKKANKKTLAIFRSLTMRGASIVALAHANKYADDSGNLVYEGTGDILADTDALYYLISDGSKGDSSDALLYREKARAIHAADEVCYRFDLISYSAEKLDHIVDVRSKARRFGLVERYGDEVEFIVSKLKEQVTQQKEIIALLGDEFGHSKKTIITLLKELDGYNWESYREGSRHEKKMFKLKSI